MLRPFPSSRLATPGSLIALLALAAAQEPASETSHHGEAGPAAQEAALEALALPADALSVPAGVDPAVWEASILPGHEPTAARVALGRELYFDRRLSADGKVSCATCHDVTRGFTDQRPVSEGIDGKLGRRNAPTTLNAALLFDQFWDGRAADLEEQAGLPIVNPIEMGDQSEEAVAQRVAALPEYQQAFQEAYGRAPSYADLRAAIAAFERTLIALDAPFDRWLAGDQDAMSEAAKRGHVLFNGKARCSGCHPINSADPLGTDQKYHNIGVAARTKDFEKLAVEALAALEADPSMEKLDELALSTDLSELGRFLVTRNYADVGAFKTEQVRNIGITAPYMHDGSLQTLWDVMDHYNKGGEDNPYLDGGIEALALTDEEIDDVVAFLFALTDVRFTDANQAALVAQRERASTTRPFKDEALANRDVLGFERRVLGEQ